MAVEFKEKEYAGRLVASNTSDTGFAIVKATEVGGHRSVNTLSELYALSTPILSISGDNTDNDAIGQLWYVASEGKHYQLVDWANRKNANGWKEFKSGGSGAGHLVYKGCTFDSFGDLTEYVGSSDYTIQESETYTGYDNVTSLSVCFDSTLNCFYLDVVADSVNYIFFSWSGLTGIKDSREYGTSKEITVTNGTSTLTATMVMAEENIVYLQGEDYKKFADGAMSSMSATDMAMDITNDELYRGDGEGGVNKLSRARVAYGTCYTKGNVAIKEVTLFKDFKDWRLEVGAELCVSFKETNTADYPRLKIGDYEPQYMTFKHGTYISGGSPKGGKQNMWIKYVYNGSVFVYMGGSDVLTEDGGTMTGELVFDNPNDDNDSTTNDPFVTIAHDVIKLEHGMNDSDKTILTTKKVESPMIVKTGGTSEQVLLADGSVAGTITTAWLETNLT